MEEEKIKKWGAYFKPEIQAVFDTDVSCDFYQRICVSRDIDFSYLMFEHKDGRTRDYIVTTIGKLMQVSKQSKNPYIDITEVVMYFYGKKVKRATNRKRIHQIIRR